MDKNNILTILVIFLIFISIASPTLFYFKIQSKTISGKASSSSGNITLMVPPDCGDMVCEDPWEDCTTCELDCGECIQICGDDICSGTETCENCPEDCGVCDGGGGSGGSGGGSTPVTRINFKFDPSLIQEDFYPGDSLSKQVNVTNIGAKSIDISLSVTKLQKFIFLSSNLVSLKEEEMKSLNALISIPKDTSPEVYIGDILGVVENVQRSLPVVLTVREKEAPIIVDVSLSEENQVVMPGEKVVADITITNKLSSLIKVNLENSLRNKLEDVLEIREGIIDLKPGENIFIDDFDIVNGFQDGYYLFYANVTYDGNYYVDAAPFRVESPSEEITGLFFGGYLIYLWIFIALILILLIIYFVRKLVKNKKPFLISKKKKKKEEATDYDELIKQTVTKLNSLKNESKSKYGYGNIEKYSLIMRQFFSKYYDVKSSLTFEEFVVVLEKMDVKKKRIVISFINKIAHIPYYYTLMPQKRFILLVEESIRLVNSLKTVKESSKKIHITKKTKLKLRKIKKKAKQ